MPAFSTKSKPTSVVGLDIDAGSVGAAEVRENGSVELIRHGVAPIESGLFADGEIVDPEGLADSLKDVFAEHKLPKTVRIGVANQRVAVRTLNLPPIADENELASAIRFQAQDQLPMPLEQAVLDWQVVGQLPEERGGGLEVVAVAARRDMVGRFVETLKLAGLRPIGIDHAAFGMIRMLTRERASEPRSAHPRASEEPTELMQEGESRLSYEERMERERGADTDPLAPAPVVTTRLMAHLGDVTNVAIATGSVCRFTRVAPTGVEGMAQGLAERRGLSLVHARQWLAYVGLGQPIEAIEGDPDTVRAAREILGDGVVRLADELRMTLEYYGASGGGALIDEVVMFGPGAQIPELVESLGAQLGQPVRTAAPAALAGLGEPVGARLALAYGTALDS